MDLRLLCSSMDGKSFLEQVRDMQESVKYYSKIYAAIMPPKFNSRIGEIT